MVARPLTILMALTTLVAVGVAVDSARATTVHPFTLEELIYVADRIVVGEVVGMDSRHVLDGTSIHTHVDIDVEEVLKGAAAEGLQVVWLLGGVVGDQVMHSSGTPAFVPGERVLLFLEEDPHGFSVLGVFQGKLNLQICPERGEMVAFQGPFAGPDMLPRSLPTIAEDAASWENLRQTIVAQVTAGHVPTYREIPGLLEHKRRAFRAHWGLPETGVGR